MSAIEVLEVRRADLGSVRAFVKLRLGGLVIHGVKVVQQPNRQAWVALPQTPGRKKADGSGAGWFPVVEVTSKELKQRITDVVLAAWDAQRQEIIPPERPPAHQAERGVASGQAIAERAARHDPGQHDTGDPGRPFEDEAPF